MAHRTAAPSQESRMNVEEMQAVAVGDLQMSFSSVGDNPDAEEIASPGAAGRPVLFETPEKHTRVDQSDDDSHTLPQPAPQHRRFYPTLVCAAIAAVALLVCVGVYAAKRGATATPTAVTPLGILRGVATPDNAVHAYLGVPYAEPPARFARAAPKKPWAGSLTANQQAPPCMDGAGGGSEDCLFLNVYAPNPTGGVGPPRADRGRHAGRAGGLDTHPHGPRSRDRGSGGPRGKAVLVWFHGGCYSWGKPGDYDGAQLARAEDVIVVMPAFRLGAFGYLYSEALGLAGWYGMWDQRQALEWVQDNIAAFGGDPARVTIAGQSSGAGGVALHYVAPLSRGLFRGAVMQSGSFGQWIAATAAGATRQTATLMHKLGCTTRACLEQTPADVLARVPLDAVCKDGCAFAPVIDGFEIVRDPYSMIMSGNHSDAPVLHGTCKDDGQSFAGADKVQTAADFDAWVLDRWPPLRPDGFPDAMRELFPPHGSARGGCSTECVAGVDIETAYAYYCPAAVAGRALSARAVAVWQYVFAQNPHPRDTPFVTHSCELPYLWPEHPGRNPNDAWARRAETPIDAAIARDVRTLWGSFVRTGNPGADWPQMDVAHGAHPVLVIGSDLRNTAALRVDHYGGRLRRQCEYYQKRSAYMQTCLPAR